METLQELGEAVAIRRKAVGLTQSTVAAQSGIAAETLCRFEQGRVSEFGARKLMALLSVLGMEMQFRESAGDRHFLFLGHSASPHPQSAGKRTRIADASVTKKHG